MKVRLGDVCTFQSGGTPSKSDPSYFGGTIPWITTVALNNSTIDQSNAVEWITEKAIKESAAKIIPTNSILVGTRVGVGKVAVNTVPISTSQDIIALLNIDETVWDKAYLREFITSKKDFLQSQARGATIKGIKIDTLAELDLPKISLSEQKHAANAIRTVSQLISLRKNQISKIDELVKSQFVEMFRVGENTEKVLLQDISEFVTVGIANSATHAYTNSGVVMLRNQNIKENNLDDDDLIYILPEFANKYKTKALKENDILVTRTGYPGVACLVPPKYEGCQTFTTLIIRLKGTSEVNPNYICHYMNSASGKEYVNNTKVGIAQQNFGAKVLGKMPVLLPSIESQNKFVTFVQQVDKSKFTIQNSLATLESLRNALMQQYFG